MLQEMLEIVKQIGVEEVYGKVGIGVNMFSISSETKLFWQGLRVQNLVFIVKVLCYYYYIHPEKQTVSQSWMMIYT